MPPTRRTTTIRGTPVAKSAKRMFAEEGDRGAEEAVDLVEFILYPACETFGLRHGSHLRERGGAKGFHKGAR